MATETQKEAFKDYVKTVLGPRAPLLKPHLPDQDNQLLLHISTDGKIKKFVPCISRRTATKEDRTIPRVSTAPHLMGCINGYCATISDFDMVISDEWKGGYYIYDIPFAVAGNPDKELVCDVDETDERWIIPFDAKHREIEPEIIGKMFMHSIYVENSDGDNRTWSPVFYVDIQKDTKVFLTKTVHLKKGYWRLQIGYSKNRQQFLDSTLSFSEITRAEYQGFKKQTAGLLSYVATAPSDSW